MFIYGIHMQFDHHKKIAIVYTFRSESEMFQK